MRAATQGLICPLGQAEGDLHKGKGSVTPLLRQTVLSPASSPQQQELGLSPGPAHTGVRSSKQRFQRGLPSHPSTCLESPWPAQQSQVQEVQLGPRSSSACRALGTPEFLGSSRDIPNSPRGRSGKCQHMWGQLDPAGLPARAESYGALDPSGWLCQSQGVSRSEG